MEKLLGEWVFPFLSPFALLLAIVLLCFVGKGLRMGFLWIWGKWENFIEICRYKKVKNKYLRRTLIILTQAIIILIPVVIFYIIFIR